ILRRFGLPVVVAVNRFPEDTDDELDTIQQIARDAGATAVAVSSAFAEGGNGALSLAAAVAKASEQPNHFTLLYPDDLPAEDKLATIAMQVYGADGIDLAPEAKRQFQLYRRLGFGELPVCIAKTQYSLSHDPNLLGRPRDFRLPIREVRLAAGAGFLYALAGDIRTMPGLPSEPAAYRIRVEPSGQVQHLT
ncbi:MAG: formate--tetrahydrofolate ligase, partial [Planctomycetota bacterium]